LENSPCPSAKHFVNDWSTAAAIRTAVRVDDVLDARDRSARRSFAGRLGDKRISAGAPRGRCTDAIEINSLLRVGAEIRSAVDGRPLTLAVERGREQGSQ
jgi:hypothetical protein